ncbi:MAG: type II toxin-antitoxin system RelE/ParE family toxin [Terriglobales bacterium]
MPLEIVWSPLARARLREIRAYVARDQPQAAERLAIRIVAVVEALRDHPYMGRVGAEPGIRELVIGGTPYIVLYRVRGQLVIVNTIWHGAQSRQAQNLRRD